MDTKTIIKNILFQVVRFISIVVIISILFIAINKI